MNQKLRMTIAYDEPDEDGWIVARVVEVPGAMSQGRTREEARANVIDALQLMLAPSKPVRSCNPRLGRFDSGAAPSSHAKVGKRSGRCSARTL
jgi:predicted RNase H-like HicB family nuclease